MRRFLGRFVASRSGTTAIEYGLIAAIIALAIVGSITAMGQEVVALFGKVSAAFN